MKTVLTIGTFDLLHVGHLELFAGCRILAEGGPVVAAVNRDSFVERFKGHRPVVPYGQRRAMVAACRDVDLAVCNSGDEEASQVIEVVEPDIIAVGSDWSMKDYLAQLRVSQAWLDDIGVEVVYVFRTTGQSSTALRGKTGH